MKLLKFLLILANVLVLLKVLLVTNLFSSVRHMADFDNYYRTVLDMRLGVNPYTISYMQTLGPPITFLYYIPYSLFNLHTAQIIFIASNIFCGVATCIALSKKYFWGLLLILFLSFLSRYSLQIGQPSLTLSLLIAVAITRKNKFLPFFIAPLIIIKSFFAISLLALVKDFRKICLTIIILVITVLLSLFIIKPKWYAYYLQNKLWSNFSALENINSLNYENQTLKSTLYRLHQPNIYIFAWLGILTVAIVYLIKSHDIGTGILFSLLLSPVVWQHYLIAIFPIIIFTFMQKPKRWPLILIAFFLWWPDLRISSTLPTTISNGLIASHFYLSLVTLTLVRIV